MATVKQPINEVLPLCSCGCGNQTKWQPGKGWSDYKKGHGQRVYGHYRQQADYVPKPTIPQILIPELPKSE